MERRFLYLVVALLLCQATVAATIDGTVYTSDLAAAKYSLLSINTTPAQRVLLEDGTYNITVPRGAYKMRATYYWDNRKYEDDLNITVVDNGQYTYDFIVFPVETNQTQTLVTPEDLSFAAQSQARNSTAVSIGWWPAALLLIVLATLAILLSRKQWWQGNVPSSTQASVRREENPEANKKNKALPDDLASVLAAIKSEGGRTTQKELRKHIPVSEAKLSMMLTELEALGKVRKIKKGRGNLIVLK